MSNPQKIVIKIKERGPQGIQGDVSSVPFVGLTDTPADYTGAAGQFVTVTAGADGLEFTPVVPGAGDMLAAVYDPTSVVGDVFDMDNMVEGLTNLILTQAERDDFHTHTNKTALDAVSGTNTGDQTLPVAGDFNHDDLANITGTPAQYNHPTNAELAAITHTNRTALDAVSGTNTGDQVSSDFSHDSLSGLTGTAGQYNHPNNAQMSNLHAPGSDDQVASDFNHDDLANITGTPGEYNHPNDSQMSNLHTNHANRAALDAVSGTNTGDQDLSGYVQTVGTPVNNQLGVWTGDGTLEGEADLTYDGSTLLVAGIVDASGVIKNTGSYIQNEAQNANGLFLCTRDDATPTLGDTIGVYSFSWNGAAYTGSGAGGLYAVLVDATGTRPKSKIELRSSDGTDINVGVTLDENQNVAIVGDVTANNLSGTNTGDQVAGDFNHDDLANITGTPAEYNHPTNAQLAAITHTNRTNLDTIDQNMATTDGVAFDNLTTDLVAFDLTAAETVTQGQLAWNADELTLDLGMDTNVTLQLGQEVVYHVQNNSGSPIADGTPVMATGTLGASGRITIAPMDATTHAYEQFYLGIATETIANGGEGKVTHFGKIRGVDTTGTLSFGGLETWNDGDVLYLDPNNIGYLTNVQPVGLDIQMPIAFVVYANATGTLFTRTMNHDLNHYVPIDQQQLTKDPTGWVDNTAIQVDYDPVARTITLTGDLRYYWRGVLRELTSPWTSSAHDATTDTTYFLYSTDGVNFTWATSVWEFDELMVAFAYYGATNRYAVVEVHGLMPWQTHREFHARQGTYKVSGGGLTDYVLDSTNSADRHPIVAATVLNDEDIYTTLPEWDVTLDGATQFYLDGAGPDTILTPSASNIVPLSGNRPYWNEFTGAVWQQTLMTNNLYMEVYLVGVPAAADADSQEYRYWWVQGQAEGSLAEMQARSALDLNLGILPTITPEFTFLAKIIIRYTAGNWVFSQVDILAGSRAAITAGPAGNYLSTVTTDATLTGTGTAGDPLSVVPPTQFVRTFTATAANTFAVGEIGFVSAAGTVTKTDADAEATIKGMLVMATAAIAGGASGTFLCIGPQTGLTGLTAGSTYYVSPTTGGITLTPPSGGQFLRVIGHALSTTELYFNPSQTWIETT